jgi:hypothetical protein
VLRRVPGDRWALRSHAILRLLGNKERIEAKLYDEFVGRPAPQAFEPRSLRRPLHDAPAVAKIASGYMCPLTMGQEHDLLSGSPAGEPPVRIILGNTLSDYGLVAAALSTVGPVAADGSRVAITPRAWRTLEDLMDSVRQAHLKDAARALFVVDAKSEWDGAWVEQALRSRPVREGRVRVAFVGGPRHALRWVTDTRFRPLPPQVRVVLLEPWSDALVDHKLLGENLPPEQFRDTLRRLTGGFNVPMFQAFVGASGNRDRFAARLKALGERLLADANLLADLGLIPPMNEVFRGIAELVGESGHITPYEITEGVLVSFPSAAHMSGLQVADFGVLMGLLVPEPLRTGDDEELRPHALNPLAAAALKTVRPMEVT